MVTWSFNSNLLSCLLHQPSNIGHANIVANLNLCTLQNSLCTKQHEKTRHSLKISSYKKPSKKPGNLLKGIVNWLGAARSVVYVCKTALDHSFRSIFSLFRLLHLFNFSKKYIKALQLWIILFPCKKCVTEKRLFKLPTSYSFVVNTP